MRGAERKFQYKIWSDNENPSDRVDLETSNQWWDTEEKARLEAMIAAEEMFSDEGPPEVRVIGEDLETDGVAAFRVRVERCSTYLIEIVEI